MSHHDLYSNLLHNAAEKWGLEVMEGRPLIGLPPSSDEGIAGNPYQPEATPPTEVIKDPDSLSTIDLFQFNGQWGCSKTINHHSGGYGYGSFLKFCDPYPDRMSALTAAVSEIVDRADPDKDKKLIKWAKGKLAPKQLSFL